MNIIGTIGKTLQAIGQGAAGAREAFKIGWSMPPKRATDLWYDYFHKTPMLDPVHMLAQDVAATPYKIFDKKIFRADPKNAEPYEDHPIYDLLDHPMPDHPEIDYAMLVYTTVVYRNLAPGEAFWLIDRDSSGKPCGVYVMPSSWMLLTPTRDIPWFRIQPMGNTSHRYFNASPNDIVWFKSPDMANPYGRGRGRTEALGDEIETHEYAAKYAKNFFYNDATPPTIISLPGATQDEIERFKESWQQKLGGFLNARKIGFVGQKDLSVHALSTTPKEMDFVETRKYLVQVANEHFCVPPEMRGDLTNSNRSTIDAADYLWKKNAVTRELRTMAITINNQFVPMFNKGDLWKFDEIVPEDKAFDLQVMTQGLTSGAVTRNEWRLAMGLARDESPHGDVYLMGAMVIETQAFDEKPQKPDEPPGPTKPDNKPKVPNENDDLDKSGEDAKDIDFNAVIKELNDATAKVTPEVTPEVPKLPEPSPKIKTGHILPEENLKAIWKSFDTRARTLEPKFVKAVKKVSADQKKLVRTAVNSAGAALESDPDAISKILDKIFTPKLDAELKTELISAWMMSMNAGKEQAVDTLTRPGKSYQRKVDDTVVNTLFSKWISVNGLAKAEEINDTTHEALKKELQAALSEGIDSGLSIKKIIASLLDTCDGVYDNMDGARASTIARTETASSENYGVYATYKSEGVKKKTWLATRDDRTREDHAEADGQTVDIDEAFQVGGEQLQFPGDPDGDAGEIVNCRCTMISGDES